MKSYESITSDLLKRRDRYVAAQKHRRKQFIGAAAALCCCLVLFFGIGILNTDSVPSDIGEPSDTPHSSEISDDRIVIHPIDSISSDRQNIALRCDDFIEMSYEEMIAYYGVDYIPEVPADIKPWPNESAPGIYKRNGGTGEVYWDSDVLNFSNENFTRNVNLEVDKGNRVFLDYLHFDGTEEKSVINNTEVLIGQTEGCYYYSEFSRNDVWFVLVADGVSENEFIAIIRSLLD